MSTPHQRIEHYTRRGLQFDVIDAGPIDGDVVVLLHGFPERATCWDSVTPLLHARGFRTLAPDQRGYSPGARPPRRRDYALGELVDDVAELIGLVGGRAHLVGHDWGANVAWSVAIDRPELVRTLTAFSVPHPAAFTAAVLRSRQGLKSWYMLMFQIPWVPEALSKLPGGVLELMLARSGMRPVDLARFRHEIVDYGALSGGLNWYRALLFLDRTRFGRKVSVPSTMVWSDGDGFIDRAGVRNVAQYVDAPYDLVVLAGVNHWIPTQAPGAAAEAIIDRLQSA